MRWLAVIALLFSTSLNAQTVGNCVSGRAEADLDVGDVFARVFNTGSLFFGNSSAAAYVVPKASNLSPIFAAGIWIGGQVNGELRVAAASYNDFEFWPGPLEDPANPPDSCAQYDRIFSVRRGDILHYLNTGEVTDDLRDWPVDLGAPVLDGDGDSSNYNLQQGDQPAIWGDQMLWWVMNDAGNEHEQTGSQPLGVEVQVSVWGSGENPLALRQGTYYRYRIINRNPYPIDSAFVSIFGDPDLGNYTDNFVGVDTLRAIAFEYNADDYDDPAQGGYGIPPSVGFKILQGPVGMPNNRDDDFDGTVDEAGERLGITAFMYFVGGHAPPYVDPVFAQQVYQVMQGRWRDGTPMREGNWGIGNTGAITPYAFPGDPVIGAYWSEVNADGMGNPTDQGGDRRIATSVGPFRLEPGESTDFVFSIVFAHGTDRFDSITQMRLAAQMVQNAYEESRFDPVRVEGHVTTPPAEGAFPIQLSAASPNPFSDQTTIRYTLPAAMNIRIAAFDVLGREVTVLVEGEQQGEHEATLDGSDLAPGVYFIRFEGGDALKTISVVKR